VGVKRYRIEFRPAALRDLRRVDKRMQSRIRGAIALLADNPRPPACRPLKGRDAFRLRVGDYRVIYAIHDDVLIVVVVTIAHRSSAYRDLR